MSADVEATAAPGGVATPKASGNGKSVSVRTLVPKYVVVEALGGREFDTLTRHSRS